MAELVVHMLSCAGNADSTSANPWMLNFLFSQTFVTDKECTMRTPKAQLYGAQPPVRVPKARSYGTRPRLHVRAGILAS